jgi:hypothetical protein
MNKNKLTPEELFFKHFWEHPCDAGYYYSEERKTYYLYARSREIATKVINKQKFALHAFLFLGVLFLLVLATFIICYSLVQPAEKLTLTGFLLTFSVILIATTIIAMHIRHLLRHYKKKIIFLPKNKSLC